MNCSLRCIRFGFFGLVLLLVAPTGNAADLNGKWNFSLAFEWGDYDVTISLEVEGENATGHRIMETFKGTFKDGKLDISGEHFLALENYEATLEFSGELDGDQIKGDASWDDYPATFVAKRVE